ncbi:MAG TPA: hypothetical protein VGF16_00290 [Bryobacteraceae bacterium]|jgi:hypothetical protein
MPEPHLPDALEFANTLYGDFFERGVRYFFPEAELSSRETASEVKHSLALHNRTDGTLDLEWMGNRYRLRRGGRAFTEDQLRMVAAIGDVLSARYRSIFFPESAAASPQLFEGRSEDRYVSAFLDPSPYTDAGGLSGKRDGIADAIDVLRQSSLITYENRRISTGVILAGAGHDGRELKAQLPDGAVPYTSALVSIKSFHRLCDGLNTVFLVNADGLLVDLVDVERYARAYEDVALPAPSAERYRAHCLATASGGSICLVLTPNGEIKIFAGGVQVFHFLEGRWRVTDMREKYYEFHQAIGDTVLAQRLFTVALNLAEHRRGGLFVVLEQAESAVSLVAPEDLLDDQPPGFSKRVHYLLRGKSLADLELTVLQSIARVDGGIVMDRQGGLLAFGAILRTTGEPMAAQEGGRTTAAMYSSRFGMALKVSEDGAVSFYRGGARVWEI